MKPENVLLKQHGRSGIKVNTRLLLIIISLYVLLNKYQVTLFLFGTPI